MATRRFSGSLMWTRRTCQTYCAVVCLKLLATGLAHSTSEYQQFQDQVPFRLILVQMLFRHGDRSPIHAYRTDPHSVSDWEEGLGQLTQTGMVQAFSYGKELKQRYMSTGTLPQKYNRSQVYVRSTDYDRTIMTAQSLVTGLYPANFSDWDLGTWQPVPVHAERGETDQLFGHAPCPLLDKVRREWQRTSQKSASFQKKYETFFDFLSNHTGMNITVDNVGEITDTVFCEMQHNMTQPSWLTQAVITELMEIRDQLTELLFAAPGTARLYGGPLLDEMTNNMKQQAKNSSTYKLLLFSAHDTNVIALSSVMGVFNKLQPPYLCSIILELFQQEDNFYVRTLFHNHSAEAPYNLTIHGCPIMCPLEQFAELLQDQMLPSNTRATACTEPKSVSDILQQNAIPALVGAVVVLAAVIVCVTYKLVRLKRRQQRANLRYRQLLQENGEVETDEDDDLESAS